MFLDYGKDLRFSSNYQIHFEKIDNTKTKIEVISIFPKIMIGICRACAPGLQDYLFSIPTEPTTIEEYKILLKIGELLGEEDEMPKIKIPNRPNENDYTE